MLVVSRRVRESVVVEGFDTDLEVSVLEVGEEGVRLSFDVAPRRAIGFDRACERLAEAVRCGEPTPAAELDLRIGPRSSRRRPRANRSGPAALGDAARLLHDETVHDLRNLLASVRLMAESGATLLPIESTVRGMLVEIQSACREAGALFGESDPTAGRERLDVTALVDGAAPLLASLVAENTTLVFERPCVPAVIRANPMQVRQVLTNLVLNASQSLQGRPGRVVVSTGSVDGDDGAAVTLFPNHPVTGRHNFLAVSDSGCGMDAATRARLFERYFSTKTAGHGLGLASIRRIVEAHDGAILVRSAPGAGTTFRVLFPCDEPTEPSLSSPSDALTRLLPEGVCEAVLAGESTPAGTVLLVDDDRSTRMLGERLLQARGWTVLTAPGGAEAVELLRTHRASISAAVLDMSMPGMDGAETLRQLRSIEPGLRAVVLSGSPQRELAPRFVHALPEVFMVKPFGIDELLDAIVPKRLRVEG